MKLIHAPGYSIRVITSSTSDEVPLCEVIVAGKGTGKILQGAVFEAALKWNDYVLLFVTNDVFFEDTLNIYLLDQALNVVDYARMYYIYATGIFSDVDLDEIDTVQFTFLGDLRWVLRLFPEKKFFIPIFSDAFGVHRPLTFYRKFQLSPGRTPLRDHSASSHSTGNRGSQTELV